ncbi:UPF0764 protein C16orf89 homolog [Leptodactylus fuscus]|uniref:UPF0764 protein C16orf89 homolog n=1 Tax=Leptodactylus fuscus TaxID=238119 RepID=UPI003F4EF226
MRLLLLLVSLSLFTSCTTHEEEIVVRNTIEAIGKAVGLLKSQYKEFNVDGLLGYTILSEQIEGTLERLDAKKNPYTSILLRGLNIILKESFINATYYTKRRTPLYFAVFEELLSDEFWTLPTSWLQTTPELVYPELSDESSYFDEKSSDECFSLLLGTSGKTKETCLVTPFCLRRITQEKCTDYALSHQLLYLMIGKMKHCQDDLIVKEFDHYANIFCANMMKVNLDIEQSGYPVGRQDLFMENILLCGLCGYSDFYKLEWMNKIISWQNPIFGCFGNIESNDNFENPYNGDALRKRVKRMERRFLDGCLSHKTSVAIASLGGFLYFSTYE